MGELERESWKSGGGVLGGGKVVVLARGVGVITNSRHWGVWGFCTAEESVMGPVGVVRVGDWWRAGVMDWKAWIGRASKNSWATIKGVWEGSGRMV